MYHDPVVSEIDFMARLACPVATIKETSSVFGMSDLMQKDLEVISHDIWYKPRNIPRRLNATLSPYVWQYKERGTKYMQQINWNDSPSIPYEMALKNFQTLQEHADNQENLTEQLELYRNKLTQLELDKENWMLECQLMKAKNPAVQSSGEMKLQDYDEIQLFVKTTVNRLIKQIQFADSKSIAFRNECEILHQKLKMSLHKKEQLENEIANARQVIERMKEEQKTLMQNYEDQLNTMSDHLANLNETLTAQKDEIDALKQAGNNKVNKLFEISTFISSYTFNSLVVAILNSCFIPNMFDIYHKKYV
ncbi:protein phosphatase 1 regulatory subunit 21-like [Stegodyphus dumicola]|uniref:protein phosphatase 1 regulatory subunit 21-like n=1 Tax=Stegodyphus dumicola TaxID=202533 RepID=UPI0015B16D44|nr:protein phosphatase 1 regulatory subunit 21-like [Stegodyphus dumicola]